MSDIVDIKKLRKESAQEKNSHPGKSKSLLEFLNRDIQLTPVVSDRFKESFYLELGTLLQAGVDIRSALELVQEGYKEKQKKIICEISEKVVNGAALSYALESIKGFGAYEYRSILIGEETGELHKVLQELATFYTKRIKQKRQIIGALTYPVMVLSVAIGAISFMLGYVVPMFSDIFKRSGDDLPAITKSVIALSGAVKNYGFLFLVILLAVIIVAFWQKNKNWFRFYSSSLLLKIPIWGRLVQKMYVARFASTMSMLLGAKIPMLHAIQLVKQIIRFHPFERALAEAEEQIMKGSSLHQTLALHSIFPRKMIVMIRVGEEVNELEAFFKKLSDQYSSEVEYQMTVLGKFIEPFIIILLGVIVGLVLIAMYLPLFQLGSSIN